LYAVEVNEGPLRLSGCFINFVSYVHQSDGYFDQQGCSAPL